MNQKGIIGILVTVLVLTLGIAVAVYLSQKPQIFKPKAAEQAISSPNQAAFGSTSLSDVALYPKPANRIQTMVYLIFNGDTLSSPAKPYLNYLASEMNYVWFDQSSLSSCNTGATVCTFENFTATTNKLKELNPSIKTGVHAGGTAQVAPYHMIYPYLNESDFLHKPDGSTYTPGSIAQSINQASPVTRQKIADGWKQVFTNNPALTGINLDGYQAYTGSFPDGCKEGPCNTEAFWIPAIFDLSTRIKAANPTKDITYNGLFYQSNTSYGGELNSKSAQFNDGALSEWPHEMLIEWTIFRKYLDVITNLTDQGKKVWFWVQPDIFKYSYLESGKTYLERNNISNDLNLERFYLATYLLIQKNPLTFFGYHPGPLYDGNQGLYFYPDWNKDYGIPLSNWTIYPTDVYVREYSNGIVAVNPYSAGQGSVDGSRTLNFPDQGNYTEWDISSGQAVTGSVKIPPKTGKFYFKVFPLKAQYETSVPANWNTNETKQFPVKVTNTGAQTWKKQVGFDPTGRTDLALYIGPDDDWSKASPNQLLVPLTADLAPGESQTLTVNMFAPNVPGSYVLRMRMVKQGIAWFEQISQTNITVTTTPVSPSPVSKPGDIDNDGDVDIFDFNTFVTDFKDNNLRSDLNGSGKVDIFDFNLLVQNFGK